MVHRYGTAVSDPGNAAFWSSSPSMFATGCLLIADPACSYCILGDGCNMEGISNEACSLAGHWGLGKLIAFYDDNKISIDGHTEISFTEDVSARFESLGWHVQHVKDGNTDLDAIRKAIDEAKSVTDKPSMIKVSTLIGYGSPNKADTHGVHGSPLGKQLSPSSIFMPYIYTHGYAHSSLLQHND